MRRIQFANHLAHDVVHLLLVGDILHQGLINGFGFRPVGPVHLRVIEAVLHDAPAFVEHLFPLLPVVDLHPGGEVDAASLKTPSGRRCGGSSSASGGRRSRTKVHGIESFSFHEIDGASVFGELQAVQDASTARATVFGIAAAAPRSGDGRDLGSILWDGVKRCGTAVLITSGHKSIEPAIGRDSHCGDVVAQMRDLVGTAGNALKVDLYIRFGSIATTLGIASAV